MTAELIPFPIKHQTAAVREVAFQLARRQGDLANKFWRTECNRFFGRLQVQGFPEAVIREQVAHFGAAVRAELERTSTQARNPKGAA